MKTIGTKLGAPVALAAALVMIGGASNAADHTDAPTATADPAADINDLYAFRSKDPAAGATARTVLVMTVLPGATTSSMFSDKVEYVFGIEDAADASKKMNIKCTANDATPQVITCSGPGGATANAELNSVVAGDAANDDMRVFAGLRDDPFFFDLQAFQNVVADPTKVGELTDNTGTDAFAGGNVLALVVDVKNTIFGGTTGLKVHATTTRTGN
jgi:hypothetical protein